MESTCICFLESDEISGIQMYSNNEAGASKSLMTKATKHWVYIATDRFHGKLFHSTSLTKLWTLIYSSREDGKLHFESELLTTYHQLDLVAVEDMILNLIIGINKIYYLLLDKKLYSNHPNLIFIYQKKFIIKEKELIHIVSKYGRIFILIR